MYKDLYPHRGGNVSRVTRRKSRDYDDPSPSRGNSRDRWRDKRPTSYDENDGWRSNGKNRRSRSADNHNKEKYERKRRQMANDIVQYIVMRTDLVTALNWKFGAVIAQACHATTATNQLFKDDDLAKQYLQDVDNMHKIVLGISSETKLTNLAKRLKDFDVKHRVWIEKPEEIPTCLVTKPYRRGDVSEFFRKLQLFNISMGPKEDKNKRGYQGGDSRGDSADTKFPPIDTP